MWSTIDKDSKLQSCLRLGLLTFISLWQVLLIFWSVKPVSKDTLWQHIRIMLQYNVFWMHLGTMAGQESCSIRSAKLDNNITSQCWIWPLMNGPRLPYASLLCNKMTLLFFETMGCSMCICLSFRAPGKLTLIDTGKSWSCLRITLYNPSLSSLSSVSDDIFCFCLINQIFFSPMRCQPGWGLETYMTSMVVIQTVSARNWTVLGSIRTTARHCLDFSANALL